MPATCYAGECRGNRPARDRALHAAPGRLAGLRERRAAAQCHRGRGRGQEPLGTRGPGGHERRHRLLLQHDLALRRRQHRRRSRPQARDPRGSGAALARLAHLRRVDLDRQLPALHRRHRDLRLRAGAGIARARRRSRSVPARAARTRGRHRRDGRRDRRRLGAAAGDRGRGRGRIDGPRTRRRAVPLRPRARAGDALAG